MFLASGSLENAVSSPVGPILMILVSVVIAVYALDRRGDL